jgi:hypothetical protein
MAKQFTASKSWKAGADRSELVDLVHVAPGKMAELMNHAQANPDAVLRNAAASTLREDDYKVILDRVKELQKLRLVGMESLMSRGLSVSTSLEDMIVQKEYVLDIGEAERSMNPTQFSDNDTNYGFTVTANPITHLTWSLARRQQGHDYKRTIAESLAMRKVMESLEYMLFKGDSSINVVVNGTAATVYGYLNAPGKADVTISNWFSAQTDVLSDARALVDAFSTTLKISPAVGGLEMYIPYTINKILDGDAFTSKGDRSFKEQILKQNPEIGAIKPTEQLTGTDTSCQIVLQNMDASNIELATAQTPTVLPHIKSVDLEPQKWTAMACMVPLFHVDANGNGGTVVGATA